VIHGGREPIRDRSRPLGSESAGAVGVALSALAAGGRRSSPGNPSRGECGSTLAPMLAGAQSNTVAESWRRP